MPTVREPPDAPLAMEPEGGIRFRAVWTRGPPPDHPALPDLDSLRTRLWDWRLLGAMPDGVGFGNVSVRDLARPSFIVTGTGTGAHRVLGPPGYGRVTRVDLATNTVECVGPRMVSAESMSHAAVYDANAAVRCVIHVHAADLWRAGIGRRWPATPADAEYGTVRMATAVAAAVRAIAEPAGLIVMAGHPDGLLFYGPSITSAESVLRRAAERAGIDLEHRATGAH